MKDQRQRAKLTKKFVEAVTSSNGTRIIVTDTEVPGFRLVVGESTKTFILEKRITGVSGSAKKLKIGIYPVISPEEARETAKRWSILCRDGQDPTKVRVESRNGQTVYMPKHTDVVTLGKAVEWHIRYKKPCESTANGYRTSIRTHMKDWLDKPLADILLHDLLARAHEIAARVSTKRARRVLADLRAIWNTAKAYSDTHDLTCPGSPLKLIKVGTLFPYNPRKVVIPFNRVGEFIHLLETWKDDTAFSTGQRRTFKLFLFSLFLGMRDTEARHLKWEYIDMDTGFFRLPGSVVKNKKDHIKPICSYALTILKELKTEQQSVLNPYVFASTSNRRGYSDRFPMSRIAKSYTIIKETMGIAFEPHALRRTFISLADEINTPRKVLKNLVNHITGDVTDGYCVKSFNPKKEAPHLDRIQQAFLILRDKHRNGEPVPEMAIDLFTPKDTSQERIDALLKELQKTRTALTQTQRKAEETFHQLQATRKALQTAQATSIRVH